MKFNLKNSGSIIILLAILFLVSQTVSAYTITGNAITTERSTVKAGITPDSVLFGLDVALDNLNLALTSDSTEKSRKGLEIARERLLEVREMIEENKLEAAEKSQKEHGKVLVKVKDSIEKIDDGDSEEEIKEVIEIEKELEEHIDEIEEVKGELKIKIKIKGEITPEQQSLIDSILEDLDGSAGEVRIEIENKKGKTKIKIRVETGKSDIEIEEEIEDLEIEAGLKEIKVRAEIINGVTEVKISRKYSTINTNQNLIIDEIIELFSLDKELADSLLKIKNESNESEEAEEKFKVKIKVREESSKVKVELKFILNSTDRESILHAIVERSQLTKEQIMGAIKSEKEKGNDELEIEVEIEDGNAEIKVKYFGEELEFELNTTNIDIIIDEIIAKTNLTREQIEEVIKVEIEDNGEDEKDEEEIECTTNSDCNEGKICIENECEKVECTTDSDCDDDKSCVENKCKEVEEENNST